MGVTFKVIRSCTGRMIFNYKNQIWCMLAHQVVRGRWKCSLLILHGWHLQILCSFEFLINNNWHDIICRTGINISHVIISETNENICLGPSKNSKNEKAIPKYILCLVSVLLYTFIHLSIYLSSHISIYLSIYLSIHKYKPYSVWTFYFQVHCQLCILWSFPEHLNLWW